MTEDPWTQPDEVLVRLRFRVTKADLVDAQRVGMRVRFLRWQSFTVPALFAFTACVVLAAVQPGASAAELAMPFAIVLVPVVLLRAGLFAAVPLLVGKQAASPYYDAEWEAEFTRKGARARTATTELYNEWSHYVARAEGRRTLLLYHSTRLFQFIPKSALDGPQREIVASLVQHLPRR